MPEIGDIKKAGEIGEIGKVVKDQKRKYVYAICPGPNCGKERWVQFKPYRGNRIFCRVCVRKNFGLQLNHKRE